MRLDGRVVMVTGAAGGIGSAIARACAEAGARIAAADLDEVGAARLAAELDGVGLGVDIAKPDAVAAAVAEATERLGTVTALVNVAGVVGGHGPLLELPVEALDRAIEVNLRGTFLMTQAVAASMVAAGEGGAIVNVSSAGAFQPTVGLGHYEATKAAVNALTRSAALELAPRSIRVNAVAPGPVDTPMTRAGLADPGARAFWASRIPLGRIATPDDLVGLVLLLLSDQAAHLTGLVVPVDGGQLLT